MQFDIFTLLPEVFPPYLNSSILKRAQENGHIHVDIHNIRDWTHDKHHVTDDNPYGGGGGMIMKPEPLKAAVLHAKKHNPASKVILMTPQGSRFDQKKAMEFASANEDLIFICGRYEGIDERIYTTLVDEEISIGDYVMTGGELASMVIIDSVARLIPGVLGSCESSKSDSFSDDRLEYAQYTRPEEFEELKVPEVLLSGNHEKIRAWRKKSSLQRTFLKRPDLFEKAKLSSEEKTIVKQWCGELASLC
jgi:tRNA (guanine37-N1)-methyltransferase